MKLNNWLLVALGCILLGSVSFTYFSLHGKINLSVSLLEAIPASSPVILSLRNSASIEKLTSSISRNNYLNNSELGRKFQQQISILKPLFMLGEENENSELVVIIQPIGSSDYDFLFLTKYPRLDIYSEKAYNYFIESGFQLDEREFRNEILISLNSDEHNICLFQEKDILALSFSSVAVETSVVALKESQYSFQSNPYSAKLEVSGNDEATVFIVYDQLASLSHFILGEEFQSLKNVITSFAGISILDINIDESGISLTGNTFGENAPVSRLPQEKSFKDFLKVIPSNANLFHLNRIVPENIKVEEFGYFKNWISGKYAYFAQESFTPEIDRSGFLLLETTNASMAKEDLNELNSILGYEEEHEYNGYTIYTTDYSSFIKDLFPGEFINLGKTECVFIEDMLVLANSEKSLEKLIDLYEKNQVLIYNPSYLDFSSYLSHYASSYFYFNPLRAMDFASRLFTNPIPATIGVQFSMLDDYVYCNILLQTSSANVFTVDETLWRLPLEANSARNVHLINNHYTNENEILVQDAANILYLVNNSGDILWSLQMEEEIIGDVEQIDFFNNGKLQLLFVTGSQIHVLDRNGNTVSPYPIKLSSKPSAGLTLVEYDQRSGPRIFVPGENGNVYGYYKDGRPLPGWSPLKNTGKLVFPLKHLINGTIDMLVAVNESGTIFCFNRKGEARFKPIQTNSSMRQEFNYKVNDKGFEAVTLSNRGLIKFYSDGSSKIDSSRRFLDSIPMVTSLIDDRWVVISERDGTLSAIDLEGNTAFESIIPWSDSDNIQLFELNGKTYVGILSIKQGQLFLLNQKGEPFEDFPMNARFPYLITNISNNGEAIMLAADEEGLFAYRLRL